MGRKKKKSAPEEVEKEKPVVEDSRSKALELAVAEIEKKFGKGSIMSLGEYKDNEPVKHISSGSLALDVILGKGGFAFGRIAEVYGLEGAGKTTLCLTLIARAQKLGLTCAFIDKENMLDAEYAEQLGVKTKDLLLAQPNTGEEALSICERLINSKAVDVVILDSVAMLNAAGDLEKNMDENAKMATRASMLTRFFERNDSPISKNKVLMICTNQLREGLSPYGPKEITTGGRALRHAASYRLDIRPIEKLQDGNGTIIGNKIRVKTAKNKLNAPFKECTYDLIFGSGIDKEKDIVDMAVSLGVFEKGGAWISYGDKKFQGINGAKEFLSDEANFNEIHAKLIKMIGPDWCEEGK